MLCNLTVRLTAIVLVLGVLSAAAAEVQPARDASTERSNLNATARLMAGLPGANTAFTQTQAWKEHSEFMRSAWARLNARQVAGMTAWRDTEFGKTCPAGSTLMYPFSGPDFFNAHWLFPGCETIVMFGLEPIGEVDHGSAGGIRLAWQMDWRLNQCTQHFISPRICGEAGIAAGPRSHLWTGPI